jgi:hypothetical protein
MFLVGVEVGSLRCRMRSFRKAGLVKVGVVSLGVLALVIGAPPTNAQERPISLPLDFLVLDLESPNPPPFGEYLDVIPGSTMQFSLVLTDNSTLPPIATLSMSFVVPVELIDPTFSANVPDGWSVAWSNGVLSFQKTGGADETPLNGNLGTLSFEVDPTATEGTYLFPPYISAVEAGDATGNPLDAGPGLAYGVTVEIVPEPKVIWLSLLGLTPLFWLLQRGFAVRKSLGACKVAKVSEAR